MMRYRFDIVFVGLEEGELFGDYSNEPADHL